MLHRVYAACHRELQYDHSESKRTLLLKGLEPLDENVICYVLSFLAAPELGLMAQTCKCFHKLCGTIIPGLKLKLFDHQIQSVRWMRRREVGGLWCVQGRDNWVHAVSGEECKCIGPPPSSREAQGGLLCDEPGLGKTITIIALIMQTSGQRSEPLARLDPDKLAAAAWSRMPLTRRIDAVRGVLKVLKQHRFTELDKAAHSVCLDIVYYSVEQVLIKMNEAAGSTAAMSLSDNSDAILKAANASCERMISDAQLASAAGEGTPDDLTSATLRVERVRVSVLAVLRSSLRELHRDLASIGDRRACPSRLRRARSHEVVEAGLVRRSAATLVVVPRSLLGHWRTQFTNHINPSFLHAAKGTRDVGETPFFWFDDKCESERHQSGLYRSDAAVTTELPPPEILSQYFLVVTTTARLSSEFKKRNPCSSLQLVQWLRIIVDEGHGLGGASLTNFGLLLNTLKADRRWVMTGTPTKGTTLQQGLSGLFGLVNFIRLPPFTGPKGADAWKRLVTTPLLRDATVTTLNLGAPTSSGAVSSAEAAYRLLVRVLNSVMVRWMKADVKDFPRLRRETHSLTLSSVERHSYNTIVSFLMANIKLVEIKSSDMAAELSILHHSNHRFAMEAMRNVRLTCCGGGQMILNLKPEYFREFRQMLADEHFADALALRRATDFVARATVGETTVCGMCGMRAAFMLVTPCVHFICPECFEPTMNRCYTCGAHYNGGDFARLQPGFECLWREAQLEAIQDKFLSSSRRQHDHSSKPSTVATAASSSTRSASLLSNSWCSSTPQRSSSMLIAASNFQSPTTVNTPDVLQESLREHSKAWFIVKKVTELRMKASQYLTDADSDSTPFKCIVFSQFRQALNWVGSSLLHAFGSDAVAEFYGKYRKEALRQFVHGEVLEWLCPKCNSANSCDDSICQRLRVFVRLVGNNNPSADEVESATFDVAIECVLGYLIGKRYSPGEIVQIAVDDLPATISTPLGSSSDTHRRYIFARIIKVVRCKGRRVSKRKENKNVFSSVVPSKIRNVDCFVLLLSREGSHGLDLSMVSHVFLLEKVWDPALEDQVVSRAWRLGASTDEVVVHTLLMDGTLEQSLAEKTDIASDRQKIQFLLGQELQLLRETSTSSSQAAERQTSIGRRVRFAATSIVECDDDDDNIRSNANSRRRRALPVLPTRTKGKARVTFVYNA